MWFLRTTLTISTADLIITQLLTFIGLINQRNNIIDTIKTILDISKFSTSILLSSWRARFFACISYQYLLYDCSLTLSTVLVVCYSSNDRLVWLSDWTCLFEYTKPQALRLTWTSHPRTVSTLTRYTYVGMVAAMNDVITMVATLTRLVQGGIVATLNDSCIYNSE